jgi:hypothetical protein
LLRQGSPHCAIFPTAASRRSLGRVSVPMWPINLSVRLPIVALVVRYTANQLIGRGPIFHRIAPLISIGCPINMLCGISTGFPVLSPCERQVAHALLTRPPLSRRSELLPSSGTVRLACVKHAASVHPEPGSNPLKKYLFLRVPLGSLVFVILVTLVLTSPFTCRRFFISGLLSRLFTFQGPLERSSRPVQPPFARRASGDVFFDIRIVAPSFPCPLFRHLSRHSQSGFIIVTRCPPFCQLPFIRVFAAFARQPIHYITAAVFLQPALFIFFPYRYDLFPFFFFILILIITSSGSLRRDIEKCLSGSVTLLVRR